MPDHADRPPAAPQVLVGAATGVGSHPGTDSREAATVVVGEVALPYLPELPARGIGADMIGRSTGLLVDVGVDASTTGYRIGARGGALARTITDLLHRDEDAFEEAYETAGLRDSGRWVKVQSAGPLTLAASLELANGHRVPRDRGALRYIAESLAEGVVGHARDVARRCGAGVVVQLDEPMLDTVLTGRIPALTRFDPIRPLPGPDAVALLDVVLDAVRAAGFVSLLHVCGPIDWTVIGAARVDAVSVDVSLLSAQDYDGIGAWVESGRPLGLGLVPALPGPRELILETVIEPATRLFDAVGLSRAALGSGTFVSPACGFAGAPPAYVLPALAMCTRAADAISSDPAAL